MKSKPQISNKRGRSLITKPNAGPATTRPTATEMKTGVNRPVDAGDHRGDRRDMSPTYTGNKKHSARGNTPRADVKTRKR